jgi:hypothetical protein
MSEHRDTVVARDGGSSSGLLLAILAVVLVLAGAWFFLLGPGANSTTTPNEINELPSVAPAAS